MISLKLQHKLLRISFDLISVPNATQKHFSFLLRRNKIISIGWNDAIKTEPLSYKYRSRFFTRHSELSAIKNSHLSADELSHLTLVNTRVNTWNRIMRSKPCDACQRMLQAFGLRNVIYTNEQGEFLTL